MKWVPVRPLAGLVIDIENKPGTYGPADYTHPKVTAVGWCDLARDSVSTEGRAFSRRDVDTMRDAAEEFREAWEAADVIVAHNGRRHDRKILHGWYDTLDLPRLPERRLVDTFRDVPRSAGYSKSLENLAERWGCPIKKPHLSEHTWEAAYDGQPWAVEVMENRVRADVAINRWLYWELIDRGLL